MLKNLLKVPALLLTALCLPLLLTALLLLVTTATDVDERISGYFYDVAAHGFPLRHDFLLENVLHDWARRVVMALAVLTLADVLVNLRRPRQRDRVRALSFALVSMILTSSLIAVVKQSNSVYCPWDLTAFGGDHSRIALLDAWGGSPTGRCWPSGHASVAWCLFAYVFAARWRQSRFTRPLFWIVLCFGVLLTLVQTARGAHFLSHGLFTGLFVWMGTGVVASIMLPQRQGELHVRVPVDNVVPDSFAGGFPGRALGANAFARVYHRLRPDSPRLRLYRRP